MGTSKNPYRVGDSVQIRRGEGWLVGTVVKTVLARVHVRIGERIFVDDYHDCLETSNERITDTETTNFAE